MKTVIDAVNELKAEFSIEGSEDQVVVAMSSFGSYKEGDIYTGSGNRNHPNNKHWGVICTHDEFDKCVDNLIGDPLKLIKWKESKNIKPVYTQSMADSGEPIKSGMLFSTETSNEYTAELVNDKSVCFTDEGGFLIAIGIKFAKPIDTRTDEEKSIDDLISARKTCKVDENSKQILEAIKAGKIHGVTWSKS